MDFAEILSEVKELLLSADLHRKTRSTLNCAKQHHISPCDNKFSQNNLKNV